jgi:pimeloyl-ACP methyl ester carboxylesterase
MWGPNEFRCSGTLAGWDPRPRLAAITAPALILGGRYDEATPAIQEDLQRRLPGSRWVLFEDSSHMPFLEETGRFLDVVGSFLADVEAS